MEEEDEEEEEEEGCRLILVGGIQRLIIQSKSDE
jgi:hypothetical protein